MTTIDVNQAFAAERTEQIAYAQAAPERAAQAAADQKATWDARVTSGKLVPLGGDRFQVNDPGSWDNGEILFARNETVAGQTVQVILPEHGLAERDGKVSVYSTQPMWHGLGTVVPGGTNNIDEVLKLAGLDWTVHTVPVKYLWNGTLRTHESGRNGWLTVRDDTGTSLGVVGRRYEDGGVIQNADAFEFLQALVDDKSVVFESAGELRGASKVFVSLRLPETVRIDVGGVNDEIVPFVVAINSHDGGSQFEVMATPWRPICGNTERFAVRDAYTRWAVRHTSAAMGKIQEARRTLKLSLKYFDAFAAEEEALARTALALDDFHATVDELWPLKDDAGKNAQTRRANRLNTLTELYDSNAERLGRTAYAGERAITEFLDHVRPIRLTADLKGKGAVVRATAVLEGNQDDKKATAHRKLMTLVRR